jgi:hypothetical protein
MDNDVRFHAALAALLKRDLQVDMGDQGLAFSELDPRNSFTKLIIEHKEQKKCWVVTVAAVGRLGWEYTGPEGRAEDHCSLREEGEPHTVVINFLNKLRVHIAAEIATLT